MKQFGIFSHNQRDYLLGLHVCNSEKNFDGWLKALDKKRKKKGETVLTEEEKKEFKKHAKVRKRKIEQRIKDKFFQWYRSWYRSQARLDLRLFADFAKKKNWQALVYDVQDFEEIVRILRKRGRIPKRKKTAKISLPVNLNDGRRINATLYISPDGELLARAEQGL